MEQILRQKVADILENQRFDFDKTSTWIDSVNGQVLNELKNLTPHFKFCVTTSIFERSHSSSFQIASSALWNEEYDGHVHHVFENDTILCSVVVFALSLT